MDTAARTREGLAEMVLASFVAGVVVAGMAAAAAGSRDSARRRREWKAQAAQVRERNRRRAREQDDRFGVPTPRESPEDSGHWVAPRA